MPKKKTERILNDLGDRQLPPHVIESLNRQMEDIENQPVYPAEEVLKMLQQKLKEIEDAQGRDGTSGTRAVA
jgi:hypothetical protein